MKDTQIDIQARQYEYLKTTMRNLATLCNDFARDAQSAKGTVSPEWIDAKVKAYKMISEAIAGRISDVEKLNN